MNTVTLQKRRKVEVQVLYYTCKQCNETPLMHPADREEGICHVCKFKKRQAQSKREYTKRRASGEKWSSKNLSKQELAANIERVVQKAKAREKQGNPLNANDVIMHSPIRLRGAQKVG